MHGHSNIQFINSVHNKEDFFCSVGVIVPIYNMSDKAVFSNYLGMSLLSTTYKYYSTFLCEG